MRENSLASVPSPTNVYQTDTRFESALLRAGSVLHINDVTPAFISAGRDLIGMGIDIPKSVQIQAGRDVTNLSLANFNVSPTDITLVKAGRDITYSEDLLHLSAGIKTGGPGLLEVLAGGKIALGFSDGITTTGNLNNSNLPSDTGADILAIAGLSAPVGVGQTAQSQDFISQIIAASSSEKSSLIDYVKQQTGVTPSDFASAADTFRSLPLIQQLPFLSQVLFTELVKSGREANANPSIGFKNGFAALESLFPDSHTPGVDNPYSGDISLPFSRIYTLAGGSISLLAPGGKIDVGLANPPGNLVQLGFNKQAYQLGIVAQKQGSVDIFTQGDVNVNSSRVFTLGGGDIAIWSSEGNIDAGRGAKSAISAPPPTLLIDSQGNVTLDVRGTVAGSGIRTILAVEGAPPGNVDLMAPAGFVNAGDAGIGSAGNLNIAAQHVIGVDNIQVGGTATGVPPETSGLGVSLSAASTAGASSSNSANSALSDDKKKEEQAPIAQSALSWLEVFVVGLGEDTCKQDDMECLRRQAPK